MSTIDVLWVAHLNRNIEDAGSDSTINLTINVDGDDAWKPMVLFVFGLDTASGRPNHVVSLASRPVWGPRWMSTDTSEGDPSVELQVTPG